MTVTDVEIKHYLVSLQLLDKWMSHLSFAFTNCIFVSLGLLGWSRNRTVKKIKREGGLVSIKAKHLTLSQTPFQKYSYISQTQLKYTSVCLNLPARKTLTTFCRNNLSAIMQHTETLFTQIVKCKSGLLWRGGPLCSWWG